MTWERLYPAQVGVASLGSAPVGPTDICVVADQDDATYVDVVYNYTVYGEGWIRCDFPAVEDAVDIDLSRLDARLSAPTAANASYSAMYEVVLVDWVNSLSFFGTSIYGPAGDSPADFTIDRSANEWAKSGMLESLRGGTLSEYVYFNPVGPLIAGLPAHLRIHEVNLWISREAPPVIEGALVDSDRVFS